MDESRVCADASEQGGSLRAVCDQSFHSLQFPSLPDQPFEGVNFTVKIWRADHFLLGCLKRSLAQSDSYT